MENSNQQNLSIGEMMDMSLKLWSKNKQNWSPMKPEYGREFILYMVEEIGEVISIIKKKKVEDIMDNPKVRERFVEELGDVLMYYIDVLNRFEISPEEFSKTYVDKFNKNMKRDYKEQYKSFIDKDSTDATD